MSKRSIEITLPFNWLLSKNARFHVGKGKMYVTKEVKEAQQALQDAITAQGGKWHEGRMWLHIFVAKPKVRIDAINFVDTIADAVKKATGVDDKWYSVTVDWELDTRDPHIVVRVTQDNEEHERICFGCAETLPATSQFFGPSKSATLGLHSMCLECVTWRTRMKGAWGRVCADLEQRGYTVLPVAEEALIDLVAFRRYDRLFVYMDTRRPKASVERRMELVDLAHDCGAVPVLVTRGLKMEVLSGKLAA